MANNMASLLDRVNANPRLQLATTAAVSGVVVASTILGFQRLQKARRISELKRSINSLAEDGEGNVGQPSESYINTPLLLYLHAAIQQSPLTRVR